MARGTNHLIVVAAVAMLGAPAAHAALDVAWDCYLPSAQIRCSELEKAFFSDPAFARASTDATDPSSPDSPEASVHVRAMQNADGDQYSIDVHGKDGSSFTLQDRVPRGFKDDAVLLRLVGDLQKATAHLFVVDEPGKSTDGVLTLALRDPTAGPRQGRDDDETTGWYLAPELSLWADSFGVTQLNAHAAMEVNWSHPAWRLHGWQWSHYRFVHVDDGHEDPEDTYQNFEIGTDWTVARTLFDGLSLAANGFVMREPQENYAFRAGYLVGVEWVLVPFLKTDEGNFGARYEIGAEHQDYMHTTVLKKDHYEYLRHRARVFGAWHFSRVDVDGGLTAASVVTDLRFSSISGNGSVTWRVLDDLSVSLGGEVSYRAGLVNEPADLDELHPLEQFYGGGAYGDVTYWANASVRYVFGNSLVLRQDQRWR